MRVRSILRALFLLGAFAAVTGSSKKARRGGNGPDPASDPVDEAGEDFFRQAIRQAGLWRRASDPKGRAARDNRGRAGPAARHAC